MGTYCIPAQKSPAHSFSLSPHVWPAVSPFFPILLPFTCLLWRISFLGDFVTTSFTFLFPFVFFSVHPFPISFFLSLFLYLCHRPRLLPRRQPLGWVCVLCV